MNPKDWIALVIVIGSLILIGLRIDGVVGAILIAVVAFYFGEPKVKAIINNNKLKKK